MEAKQSSETKRSTLTKSLNKELQIKQQGEAASFHRVALLRELYRLHSPTSTKLKRNLRKYIKKNCKSYREVTLCRLKREYQKLSKQLSDTNSYPESKRTFFEKEFKDIFEKSSKRTLYPAAWVGGTCVDVLCPSIRSPGFCGLVFEICGELHDKDGVKIEKDERKARYLHRLRIAVVWIDNRAVHRESIRRVIEGLASVASLDSRARRSLWARIYTETIGWPHPRISDPIPEMLGISPSQLQDLLNLVLKYKYAIRRNAEHSSPSTVRREASRVTPNLARPSTNTSRSALVVLRKRNGVTVPVHPISPSK